MQIGGQYLVALDVAGLGDQGFKAKVAPTVGEHLPSSGQVNVELPLDRVSLFDAHGIRIAASLHPAGAPIADCMARPFLFGTNFKMNQTPAESACSTEQLVGVGSTSAEASTSLSSRRTRR